ncbi:substrate-binding domain-containing protein [bacterium]|nr:substrate-binding domain-containing protein [bacterium]
MAKTLRALHFPTAGGSQPSDSPPRRVALAFELHDAPQRTRQVLLGIHEYARSHSGRWLCIHDPHVADRLDDQVDGVIGPASRPLIAAARRLGIAHVAATSAGWARKTPRVVEHRRHAGVLAARHLIECDYERFGFVGFDYDQPSRLLEDGYRRTLRADGQSMLIHVYAGSRPRKHAAWGRFRERLGEFLDALEPPVGLFACRDVLALQLAELCALRGLRIPEDVGIIGAGNDRAVCDGAPVPLSSIDFDLERVGTLAAALLDHLMAGGAPPMHTVTVRPTLVPRRSTGRTWYGDTLTSSALAYISAHCHERIRVADVAAAVGLSDRQLLVRFRRGRGRTVVQEIARARLRHAEDLLHGSDLSVEAVARAVGYATGRHLNRLFVEHHRMTAAAWRRGRPDRPRIDPEDIRHAKRLLDSTGLRLSTIAMACGFRTTAEFRAVFRSREGVFPGEYRKQHRSEPRRVREVTVTFDDMPEDEG